MMMKLQDNLHRLMDNKFYHRAGPLWQTTLEIKLQQTPEALRLTPAKRTFDEAAADQTFDVSFLRPFRDERSTNSISSAMQDHYVDFDND